MNTPEARSRLPFFVSIGAQRSGTSWLYYALSRHPDIFVTPVKELHYLDSIDPAVKSSYKTELRSARLARHGIDSFKHLAKHALHARKATDVRSLWSELRWLATYFTGNGTLAWYQSLFETAASQGKVTGEITPAYALLSGDTIGKLKQLNDNLKIIYLLRNPIDRSWSHAVKDLVRRHVRTVEEVPTEAFIEFFNSEGCLKRSDYVGTLETWRIFFPDSQIFIGFYEEIEENPAGLLARIFRFLEVDDSHARTFKGLHARANPAASGFGKRPEAISRALAALYEPELRVMKDVIGGPARQWHQEALDLLDGHSSSNRPSSG
jgi:hypothetical protein